MAFHQTDKTPPKGLEGHEPGLLYLRSSPGGRPAPYTAYVMRISPVGIRVAVHSLIAATLQEIFLWNREVDLELRLPAPLAPVITRARLVGVATNYNVHMPPMIFDLDFLQITEDEERALRDTHPQLVVA